MGKNQSHKFSNRNILQDKRFFFFIFLKLRTNFLGITMINLDNHINLTKQYLEYPKHQHVWLRYKFSLIGFINNKSNAPKSLDIRPSLSIGKYYLLRCWAAGTTRNLSRFILSFSKYKIKIYTERSIITRLQNNSSATTTPWRKHVKLKIITISWCKTIDGCERKFYV